MILKSKGISLKNNLDNLRFTQFALPNSKFVCPIYYLYFFQVAASSLSGFSIFVVLIWIGLFFKLLHTSNIENITDKSFIFESIVFSFHHSEHMRCTLFGHKKKLFICLSLKDIYRKFHIGAAVML